MYEGGLVTFRLKDKETLLSVPLTQLEVEINENGLLIKNKENGEEIGYFEDVYGIDFYEMMQFFGYEFEE